MESKHFDYSLPAGWSFLDGTITNDLIHHCDLQHLQEIQQDYSSFRYWKAGIFNRPFMIQNTGQYKGYPLRHTANEVGFSDHFPVYIYLIKEVK